MANFTKKHGARPRAMLGLLGAAAMLLAALGVSSCKGDSDDGDDSPQVTKVSISATDANGGEVSSLKFGESATIAVTADYSNGDKGVALDANGAVSFSPAESADGVFSTAKSGKTIALTAKKAQSDTQVTLTASAGGQTAPKTITIKAYEFEKPSFSINGEGKLVIAAEDGAKIYYTTDGSAPTGSSDEYTAPIDLGAVSQAKAIAKKDGVTSSVAETKIWTVTFKKDAADAEAFATKKALDGGAAAKPDDPAKDGYSFNYWAKGGEPFDFDTGKITEDTALAADWTLNGKAKSPAIAWDDSADAIKVKITSATKGAEIWYTTDGSEPDKDKSAGTKYTAPVAITKSATVKAIAYEEGLDPSAVVDFKADIFTVTFNLDGGAGQPPAPQTVRSGGSAKRPSADPTREGKNFNFWAVVKAGAEPVAFDFTSAVTADTTITAVWLDKNTVATPAIAWKDDGSDVVTITCSTLGAKIWYTTDGSAPDSTKTEYVPKNGIAVSANATIMAIATKEGLTDSSPASFKAKFFTVTFAVEKGLSAPDALTVHENALAAEPGAVKKSESDFIGWFAEGAKNAFDFTKEKITEDITLTAKLEDWPQAPKPVITWDDSALPANKFKITCNWGAATPDGATIMYFIGAGTPEEYTAPVEVTKTCDVTAYAVATKMKKSDDVLFKAALCAVTFDVGDGTGTAPDTQMVRAGGKATAPDEADNPTKAKNDFAGWFSSDTATDPFDFATEKITEDVMLTAKFTPWKQAPKPVITCNKKNNVTITVAWGATVPDGATIVYTTDGSEPSEKVGDVYTAPFPITADTTVKAAAYADEKTLSEVAEKECAYTAPAAPKPSWNCTTPTAPVNIEDNGQGARIFVFDTDLDVEVGDMIYIEATFEGDTDRFAQLCLQSNTDKNIDKGTQPIKHPAAMDYWADIYEPQSGIQSGTVFSTEERGLFIVDTATQDMSFRFCLYGNATNTAYPSPSDVVTVTNVHVENRGPIEECYSQEFDDPLTNKGSIGAQDSGSNRHTVTIPFVSMVTAEANDELEITFEVKGASNYQQVAFQTNMRNYSDYFSVAVGQPGVCDGLVAKVNINHTTEGGDVKGPFIGKFIFSQLDPDSAHPGYVYDPALVSNIQIENLTIRNLTHADAEPVAEWANNDGSAYNPTANALTGVNGGAMAFAQSMGAGWNLGNNFDPADLGKMRSGEGIWNNPPTNQTIINAVAAAGFKSIRIPITWLGWLGDAPNYTIHPVYMKRIKEVVGWAQAAGLKVIINVHHDCDGDSKSGNKEWLDLASASPDDVKKELYAVWYQIAKAFKGTESDVVFETLNEPHKGSDAWRTSSQSDHDLINEWNQIALRAIRNAGAKNKVSFPSYAANPEYSLQYVMPPTDVMSNALIAAFHCYDPQKVALNAEDNTWADKDKGYEHPWDEKPIYGSKAYLRWLFGQISNKYVDNGIPAIMGECGCTCLDLSDSSVRAEYDGFIVEAARNYGIVPVIWDNGVLNKAGGESSGLFERVTGNIPAYCQPVINAIMSAATTSTWNTGDLKPATDVLTLPGGGTSTDGNNSKYTIIDFYGSTGIELPDDFGTPKDSGGFNGMGFNKYLGVEITYWLEPATSGAAVTGSFIVTKGKKDISGNIDWDTAGNTLYEEAVSNTEKLRTTKLTFTKGSDQATCVGFNCASFTGTLHITGIKWTTAW